MTRIFYESSGKDRRNAINTLGREALRPSNVNTVLCMYNTVVVLFRRFFSGNMRNKLVTGRQNAALQRGGYTYADFVPTAFSITNCKRVFTSRPPCGFHLGNIPVATTAMDTLSQLAPSCLLVGRAQTQPTLPNSSHTRYISRLTSDRMREQARPPPEWIVLPTYYACMHTIKYMRHRSST